LILHNFADGGCILFTKQALPPAGVCPHCQNNRVALGRKVNFYSVTALGLTIPLTLLVSPRTSDEWLPQFLHFSVVGMASLLIIESQNHRITEW